MKRAPILLLLSFFLVPLGAQVARAECYKPNCWGAIAINTHTGRWGWSVNWANQGTARSRALARCTGQCNRSLVFRNSCGAYATPSTFRGGYGWATRYDRYAAEAEALRQCRRYNPGQGCRVRVWACTSRQQATATPPPPPPPPANTGCNVPYCWGAIAINTNTGRWGWSVNHPSRGAAHSRANAKCRYGCNRTLTFQNQCGAYATPSTFRGGYGWATRYDRYAAEAEALRQCRLYNPGQGCRVRVWACTSRRAV